MNNNKRFWNIISPLYNRFMRNNRVVYSKVADCITERLNSEMKVLELGCGTGEFTELLASKTKEWIATDFSKQMVDNTSKRLNEDKIRYKVEDATALTFDDNSFDAVMIANTLHIMPNPYAAMKEIHRVLKNDGLLLAPTFVFDKRATKIRVKLLELIGFKVYSKWDEQELCEFIENNHFIAIHQSTVAATPLSESIIIARCKKENIMTL